MGRQEGWMDGWKGCVELFREFWKCRKFRLTICVFHDLLKVRYVRYKEDLFAEMEPGIRKHVLIGV